MKLLKLNILHQLGIVLVAAVCLQSARADYTYTVLPVIPNQRIEQVTETSFFGSRLNNQDPSGEYGVPENSLQNSVAKFEPVKYEKAVLLDTFPTYTPSQQQDSRSLPSATYGPPSSEYGAPSQAPSAEYGIPISSPEPTYGAPSSDYEAPGSSPAPTYGAPSSEYGAPGSSPAPVYGAPDGGLEPVSVSPVYGPPGGLHGKLESPILAQLRERVHQLGLNPLLTTDKQLERYLEGFNYRVERVIRWLTRTALWRRSRGIDEILKHHPADYLTTNLPYECTGYTNEGNPVMYVPIGRWNFRTALRMGSSSEIYNYMVRMLEEARSLTVGKVNPKTGWPVDQVVIILDAQGYSLKNLLSKRISYTLLRFFKTVSKHYPFFVKKWFVPRAPLLVRGMWQVVRKVVSRRTRDHFEVYTLFSTRGAQALLHYVPKNAVPVELGGTYIPRYAPPPIEVFQLPSFSAFGSANANYDNNIW